MTSLISCTYVDKEAVFSFLKSLKCVSIPLRTDCGTLATISRSNCRSPAKHVHSVDASTVAPRNVDCDINASWPKTSPGVKAPTRTPYPARSDETERM